MHVKPDDYTEFQIMTQWLLGPFLFRRVWLTAYRDGTSVGAAGARMGHPRSAQAIDRVIRTSAVAFVCIVSVFAGDCCAWMAENGEGEEVGSKNSGGCLGQGNVGGVESRVVLG